MSRDARSRRAHSMERAAWSSHVLDINQGPFPELEGEPAVVSILSEDHSLKSYSHRVLQDARDPTWAHFREQKIEQQESRASTSHADNLTPWRSGEWPKSGMHGERASTNEGKWHQPVLASSHGLGPSTGRGARPLAHQARPDVAEARVLVVKEQNRKKFASKGERWPSKPNHVWDVAKARWVAKPPPTPEPDWADDLAVSHTDCLSTRCARAGRLHAREFCHLL
jgi:hypothetical protein